MRLAPRLRALSIAAAVTVIHFLFQWSTWVQWDRALAPGEPRVMPALWPILSFPVLPLYQWLSGGDRAMFASFGALLFANSLVWGFAAWGLALLFRRPR